MGTLLGQVGGQRVPIASLVDMLLSLEPLIVKLAWLVFTQKV